MVWMLDPAAPGLKVAVPGGPKLVKTDPKTGQVLLTIPFPKRVVPRKFYLNDVRIDLANNYAAAEIGRTVTSEEPATVRLPFEF